MSSMGEFDEVPTAWDRRVVRAMSVADSARNWAASVRVIGLLVIVGSLLGNYLLIYRNDFEEFDDAGLSGSLKLGQFLQQATFPVALGGVVLALSILVNVYASRLDLDIVLADNDETNRSAGDSPLPPPAP